jgi:DNA-3-methyladenine glycosylase
MTRQILGKDFFGRHTPSVARELLGKKLVRNYKGQLLTGMVIETEAYLGAQDSASHAFRGKTSRNAPMFGPAGLAYVYLIYGLHNMLNVGTETEDVPGAILIRSIVPIAGIACMEALRGCRGKALTNGPAKLCQALAIDRRLHGLDLTRGEALWFENYRIIPQDRIHKGPRIGISYARPKDREAPLRFWIDK